MRHVQRLIALAVASVPIAVAIGLTLQIAHGQPAPPPLNLTATAPVTVTPSGVGNTPRVIACPTCGTASGNVTGPAGATSGHIATFNGTTGLIIQDGGAPGAFPITAAGSTQSVGQMIVTGTNAGMAIIPNGTGAIMAAVPDGTAAGGNARGANAIDLQTSRGAATQIASGAGATALGRNNTAGGADSAAIGTGNTSPNGWAIGNGNTANGTSGCFAAGNGSSCTGQNSAAIGGATASGFQAFATTGGTASGAYSTVSGKAALDHGNQGAHVRAGNVTGSLIGESETYVLYKATAGTAAVQLTVDGNGAGTTNIANLPDNNTSRSFGMLCVLTDLTTRATLAYTLSGGIMQRGANAASFTIGTTPAPTLGSTTTSPPTVTLTVAADTTNAGLNIQFTPPAANTDTWHAVCTITATWVQ